MGMGFFRDPESQANSKNPENPEIPGIGILKPRKNPEKIPKIPKSRESRSEFEIPEEIPRKSRSVGTLYKDSLHGQ